MRVLLFGDMDATGFGTVTTDMGRALLDLGLDLRFISQNSFGQLAEPFASRTIDQQSIVSTLNPTTGLLESTETNSIIGQFITGKTTAKLVNGDEWGDWAADAVILLADYRAAEIFVNREPEAFMSVPVFHYIPIEGVGLPPSWGDFWRVIKPIAMSNFGADEIAKVAGERPPVVYHGVDTEAFYPVSKVKPIILGGTPPVVLQSKDDCKRMWSAWFGAPVARKWMLRTDRHMPRKRYNSMLRSLIPVLARQPDTTIVIHCSAFDFGGNLPDTLSKFGARLLNQPTENQPQQCWAFGDRPYAQVCITDTRGLSRTALLSLYNAADLYVSTSAEGFGLTIAEALACGVPAVALDYSAVPEVVGPAGVCVPVAYLVENEYDHFWAAVDEDELARRVEFLLTHQSRREELGRKGPAHVASTFRWDSAALAVADVLHASVVTPQAA